MSNGHREADIGLTRHLAATAGRLTAAAWLGVRLRWRHYAHHPFGRRVLVVSPPRPRPRLRTRGAATQHGGGDALGDVARRAQRDGEPARLIGAWEHLNAQNAGESAALGRHHSATAASLRHRSSIAQAPLSRPF